ncbi:MAG: hypothetical protein GY940_34675, partial [bacterium]|nr:hypothetical protein [bacterium]
EAFEHQGYPFDLLVEKINPRRYTNYQPLFNVGFAFQNFTDVSIQLDLRNPDDTFSPDFQPFETRSLYEETNHYTAIFDLVLFVTQPDNQLELTMEYNSRLFKGETIQGYLEDIEGFLESVTSPSS